MVILFLVFIFFVGGLLGYAFGQNAHEYEHWKEGYEEGRKNGEDYVKNLQQLEVKKAKRLAP